MTILAADEIGFSYRDHPVLHDVSLTARPGRVTSIIGPNGAGKTTLLKCLNGLLEPAAGRAMLDGRSLADIDRRERAKLLAYVPQSEVLRFPISVFDAVLLGRRPYVNWSPRRSDLEIVADTIELVGLSALAHRDLRHLSGGERQQVGIAKAIAQQPRVLLLDEPTTYLDLFHQLHVLELVRHVATTFDVVVVQTIHDLNHALAVSDQVVVLSGGRVVADGAPGRVDADLVQAVYGVPCDVVDHGGRRVVVPHALAPRISDVDAALGVSVDVVVPAGIG